MMKYKTNVLTKIESQEVQIEYVVKKLKSSTITAVEAIEVLEQIQHKSKSIRDLIEAE